MNFSPVEHLNFSPVEHLNFSPVGYLNFPPVKLLNFSPVEHLNFSPVGYLNFSPVKHLNFSPVKLLNFSPVEHLNFSQVEPTFWEFVQYVLSHPTGDPHWKPFTQVIKNRGTSAHCVFKVCTVCSVTYDYILHFEDLDIEEEEMLEQLGLRKV